jgi:hypothetical protein
MDSILLENIGLYSMLFHALYLEICLPEYFVVIDVVVAGGERNFSSKKNMEWCGFYFCRF